MNNQYQLSGLNLPHWKHPVNLNELMNQPAGAKQTHDGDQAMGDSMPELMNQGGSTKHGSKGTHPSGKNCPEHLGKMMGQ